MKISSASWIVVLLFGLLSQASPADSAPEEVFPPGFIKFDSAHVSQVLELYAEFSGLELMTSSHVNRVPARITLQSKVALKHSEVIKLLEKAFLEQAGVVITKLDDKRASVTYNDALPVPGVTNPKPMPRPIGPDGKPLRPPTFPPLPTRSIQN